MRGLIRGLVTVGLLLGAVAVEAGQVVVRALGNEGFLVSSSRGSVLVDGLYRGLDGYPAPSAAELEVRVGGQPPFHRVALVLASHFHGDHFDPEAVAGHLARNRVARFVSTPQAVAALRASVDDMADLAARVVEAAPEEGKRLALEGVPGDLVALNLHHGRGRTPPVENLGFLFTVGGARFLHLGDTEAAAEELLPLRLSEDGIEVAFVPFWLLTEPGAVAGLQKVIGRSTTVLAMHLPSADAPPALFGEAGALETLVDDLRQAGAVVLAPGEELRLAGRP